MATLQSNDDQVQQFVLDRLTNYNNSAEGGKAIPPRQRGSSRVPSVTSLQIIKTQQQTGGTIFTLAWTEPADDPSQPIDHYNIYTTRYINNNSSPVGLVTSQHSPATIFVPADAQTPVTFSVQTVLKNGTTSSLSVAPTTSGIADLPVPVIPDGYITGSMLADGSVDMTKFISGLQAIPIVGALPTLPDATYPQGVVVFLTTDNKLYRSTGAAWIKSIFAADLGDQVQASNLAANSVIAGKIAAGAVTATELAAAAVDATKLNIKQIIVVGMTLTNNSPGAGQIAWSACSVYWNGSAYSVAGGNTSTTDKFIYWDSATTSFTAAMSFTPMAGRFLIATNNSGTADEAWNKLANSSVQEDNLSFTLLQGFQMQPIASVTGITQNVGSPTTTTILNLTPPRGGVLLTIGVFQQSTLGGGSDTGLTTLSITVDGATPETITLYDFIGIKFNDSTTAVATKLIGNGANIGDLATLRFDLGFQTSLNVSIDVAAGGSDGTLDVYALYALRV